MFRYLPRNRLWTYTTPITAFRNQASHLPREKYGAGNYLTKTQEYQVSAHLERDGAPEVIMIPTIASISDIIFTLSRRRVATTPEEEHYAKYVCPDEPDPVDVPVPVGGEFAQFVRIRRIFGDLRAEAAVTDVCLGRKVKDVKLHAGERGLEETLHFDHPLCLFQKCEWEHRAYLLCGF